MAKKKQGPVRFAIYSRCSSDDQRHGDFTTIDAQREINTAYVTDKGGVLVKAYADEGKTGTNLKRAGWKALIADAQAGLFDAVVVTYMSCLARGPSITSPNICWTNVMSPLSGPASITPMI